MVRMVVVLAMVVVYISSGVDSGSGIASINGRVIKSASGGIMLMLLVALVIVS